MYDVLQHRIVLVKWTSSMCGWNFCRTVNHPFTFRFVWGPKFNHYKPLTHQTSGNHNTVPREKSNIYFKQKRNMHSKQSWIQDKKTLQETKSKTPGKGLKDLPLASSPSLLPCAIPLCFRNSQLLLLERAAVAQ